MTDTEMKALFESMAKGQADDQVEVFRTLRVSGRRDAVLRALGKSHVLHGVREIPNLRVEGRVSSIRLVTAGGEVERLDPEATVKAILAVVTCDPKLLNALRRELNVWLVTP